MPKLDMVKDGHLGGYIRGGDPGTWCPRLWSWAVTEFKARSVLDVGCGEGHSTRYFHEQGCDVLGVDGCPRAIADSVLPQHVARHDFCDGPFLPSRPYDLVWSCEFLEHVEKQYVPNILQTFAAATQAILITHALPGQDRGHHHVNCQPSVYWIRQIEALGFVCDVERSREARRITLADYPGVNHFAKSGLVFVRTSEAPPCGPLGATWKAWRIHWGFRWSSEFRQHRRQRKRRPT